MTRNNLADHLTWLLRNTSLSKPTTTVFPSNNECSSLEASQSQPRSSVNGSQALPALLPDSDLEHKPQVAVSRNPDGQSAAGNVLEETTEATLDNWNMGRLTSTSKSKKPSLVSRLEQLPTPTPTKEQKPLKRFKDAAPPTASTSTPGTTL